MQITVLNLLNDVENLRKMCGFSKEVVSTEIGTSRMTYTHWTQGKHIPSARWEPEFVRTIMWMQGLVKKRDRKEKKNVKQVDRNEDQV
jgi:hypothetical protein